MNYQYTAKYTKIPSGYMVQIIEWQEVITEGKDLEECRYMLQDALKEMVLAYQQQGKEIPLNTDIIVAQDFACTKYNEYHYMIYC